MANRDWLNWTPQLRNSFGSTFCCCCPIFAAIAHLFSTRTSSSFCHNIGDTGLHSMPTHAHIDTDLRKSFHYLCIGCQICPFGYQRLCQAAVHIIILKVYLISSNKTHFYLQTFVLDIKQIPKNIFSIHFENKNITFTLNSLFQMKYKMVIYRFTVSCNLRIQLFISNKSFV